MALLFMDGFDHYTYADIGNKWNSTSNSSLSASARTGSGCLHHETSAGQPTTNKSLGSNLATFVLGFAFWTNTLNVDIVYLYETATQKLRFKLNSSGQIEVYNQANTLLGTSAMGSPLTANVWNHIEIKATIHASAGTVEVRVNGSATPVINLTGQVISTSGNAYATSFQFQPGSTFLGIQRFDDVHLCDTTGSQNNNFLGDSQVLTIYPSGDGNSSQWVGSDGNSVNNSLLVDEAQHNGDTDYVQSDVVSNKDTYAMQDIATTGVVRAVATHAVIKKNGAGSRTVRKLLRSGTTDYESSDINPGTTYSHYSQTYQLNPDTSAAWTPTEVNGMQLGIKVQA